MVRKGVVILGIGLALLAAIGLAVDRQAHLLWFDVLAAVLSIGEVGLINERDLAAAAGAGPAVIAVGLTAVWIVGLASHQPAWTVWANFAFACAYLLLAIAAAARGHRRVARQAHA